MTSSNRLETARRSTKQCGVRICTRAVLRLAVRNCACVLSMFAWAHQLFAVLLQLLAAGLSQAGLQSLVLQLLLQLLKLLPAHRPLLQLADAPCPLCQLNLQHSTSASGTHRLSYETVVSGFYISMESFELRRQGCCVQDGSKCG